MINLLGKFLVLLNVAFSVFLLAGAVAIYTNQIDWGWMDPRVETKGVRIASEVDKRTAVVKDVARYRERATTAVKNGLQGVQLIEQRLPLNRIWYMQRLRELRSGEGDVEVLELEKDKGAVSLDPREPERPKLEKPLKYVDAQNRPTQVKKSYQAYLGDLKKVQEEIEGTIAETKKLLEQQKEITVRMNGVTEGGKLLKPGLYHLLDVENQKQTKVKQETEAVRPRWATELVEAQLLLERRQRLEARLEQLKAVRPGGRK